MKILRPTRVKGGMPIDRKDGRVHPLFTFNPKTLRSACQNPNLQNCPRPVGIDDPASIIRNLFIAQEGSKYLARDFSGIEALLVGYFAAAPAYMRLAKRDVHSFYTAYALHELDGRVSANDLPLLSWDDDRLFTRLEEIKKEFKHERNSLYKHLIHGCVTGDHEILTPEGWVRFDFLKDETPVAQWDNGRIEFTQPSRVVRQEWSGDLTTLTGSSISAVMTPDHRLPVVNSFGKIITFQAGDNLPSWGRIPTTGIKSGTHELCHEVIQLLVAVQADAALNGGHVIFHLVRSRKIERLLSILKDLKIVYSVTFCGCHEGGVRIGFNIRKLGLLNYLDQKKNFNLSALMNLNIECRKIFLEELPYWDGCRGGVSGKQTCYISTNRHNIDVVQTIAHITGLRSVVSKSMSSGWGTKPVYRTSLAKRSYASLSSISVDKRENYDGIVYCVTVPSGWFLIRHDGKISVTGNSNFMQSPRGANEKIYLETGIEYPIKLIERVMDIYFDLFPEIKKWHHSVLSQADRDGFLRNPFGYILRFNKVFDWEKIGGKWQKHPGPEANEVIAFLPQSTAAGIIKEAMIRLYYERYEEAGQYLRLLIHDELFSEVPLDLLESVDEVMREEMEKPIPELTLPASYGMGDCLSILTEAKVGTRWGEMS